jgi:hypothetical protein
VRSPRVRISSDATANFNLGNRKVSATLHSLSLTGGLVQFHDDVGDLTLAEVVLTTTAGPIKALVELLWKKKDGSSCPFRFVALDDPDFERLATALRSLRKQGVGG